MINGTFTDTGTFQLAEEEAPQPEASLPVLIARRALRLGLVLAIPLALFILVSHVVVALLEVMGLHM